MKKLVLVLIIGLMTACGIDEIDEAHYETAFIFKKLDIEFDEIKCVQNSSRKINWNCVISKKDEIIGTSECHYQGCSISLR